MTRQRLAGSPLPGAPPAKSASRRVPLPQLERENALLRKLVSVQDQLDALVLQGAGADAIAALLSRLLESPVLLLDKHLRRLPLAPSSPAPDIGWEPNETYVGRVLQTIQGERRALRLPPYADWGVAAGCVLAPVVIGTETQGYVAILEGEEDEDSFGAETHLLSAQHAANLVALCLMREEMAQQVSSELRDELLEGLLLGQITDEQAAAERLRRLGLDDSLPLRVLVLTPTEAQPAAEAGAETAWTISRRMRAIESVSGLLREAASGSVLTLRGLELVALMPSAGLQEAERLGGMVLTHVRNFYPDWLVTIGVGGEAAQPSEVARSYAQAKRAVEVALRFGQRGRLVTFESLGLYRLLFQVSDRAELRAFVDQVLGPLIEYDRRHRTDLVRTLSLFLEKDNSLQATARELFIHVNTAAYRIQRIQAITGLNLSSTNDCLQVKVALMALDDAASSSAHE